MHYTYVGIDSHKETHTAVFIDCFFEKLGEITFDNLPSKFDAFLADALKLQQDETILMFGLEDISMYGRSLAVFLRDNKQQVKHVNALLVARERKNRNITEKTDSVDAECAARVLLSKFGGLPDAEPQDDYWILRTLVVRRSYLVRNNTALKNHLHTLLTAHYPNYQNFFDSIDCKTSLAFFMKYPSPMALKTTTLENLTVFLHKLSNGRVGAAKAQEIFESGEDIKAQFQEIRDEAVRSAIRQIQFNMQEIQRLETTLKQVLSLFGTTLTSMTGIDVVTASRMLSCIGDIKRFSAPAKLARFSGVAPVTYASGKKDLQFANQRGNRELNSQFYKLAVRLIGNVGSTKKVINPFFHEYYRRKLSEGKTKQQALKCVERRLVNIIWTMLTKNEEYINPPMYDLGKKRA